MSKPKVVVLNGASVDGKLAISPEILLLYGDQRWTELGGTSAFDIFEWLKAEYKPEATLEGSGSFVREGDISEPLEPVDGDTAHLHRDFLPEKLLNRPGHKGWFTVVDGRGRIRWMHSDEYPDDAWKGWHLLLLVCKKTPAEYLAYLQREQVPYLVGGNEQVDLGFVLEKMNQKLNVKCVISTAGGKLNGALLRNGLVDEINIEFLPAIVGGNETPSLFTSPALKPDEQPVHLKLLSAQVQPNGRVWLRYQIEEKVQ